jgi:hypothetical protein
MEIKIREALPADFRRLTEILKQNNMLDFPEIDGLEAMFKIRKLMGKYFLMRRQIIMLWE